METIMSLTLYVQRVVKLIYVGNRQHSCNLTNIHRKASACIGLCVAMVPKSYHWHGQLTMNHPILCPQSDQSTTSCCCKTQSQSRHLRHLDLLVAFLDNQVQITPNCPGSRSLKAIIAVRGHLSIPLLPLSLTMSICIPHGLHTYPTTSIPLRPPRGNRRFSSISR
jgi:hypothetical protein